MLVGADDADLAEMRAAARRASPARCSSSARAGPGTVAKLVNNQLFLGRRRARPGGLRRSVPRPGSTPPRCTRSSGPARRRPYVALAPLLLGRTFDDVIFRLDIAAKDLTLAVDDGGRSAASTSRSRRPPSRVYRDAIARRARAREAFHVTLQRSEDDRRSRAAPADESRRGRRDRRGTTDEAPVVDLSDDETFRAGFPHDHFAWLRAHDPVSWHAPTPRTPTARGSGSSADTPT